MDNKTLKYGLLSAVLLIILLILVLFFVRYRPFIVLSGSMEPSVHTGSVVFADRLNKSPVKNDIITVRVGDSYVTHRFCRMEDGRVITKGDANKTEDHLSVTKEKIVGVISFTIPCIGYLLLFVQRTWYLGFPAFLLLYCLVKLKGNEKDEL